MTSRRSFGSHPLVSVDRFLSVAQWQARAASPERLAPNARADTISEPTHDVWHWDGLDYRLMLLGEAAPSAPSKWTMAVDVTTLVFAHLMG